MLMTVEFNFSVFVQLETLAWSKYMYLNLPEVLEASSTTCYYNYAPGSA